MDEMPVQWAGLNHLALITNDLDRTTRFWHGVLGAPLVATLGTEAFRHYFFDVGQGATVAFFEYRGHQVDRFAKPAVCRLYIPRWSLCLSVLWAGDAPG